MQRTAGVIQRTTGPLHGFSLIQRCSGPNRSKFINPNETKLGHIFEFDYMGNSYFEGTIGTALTNFTSKEEGWTYLKFTRVQVADKVVKFRFAGYDFDSMTVVVNPSNVTKVMNLISQMVFDTKEVHQVGEECIHFNARQASKWEKYADGIRPPWNHFGAWLGIDKDLEFFMWLDHPDLKSTVDNVFKHYRERTLSQQPALQG